MTVQKNNQAVPRVPLSAGLYDAVKRTIAEHIAPMELVGECSKHGNEWRALVAVSPNGPLVLAAFKVVV